MFFITVCFDWKFGIQLLIPMLHSQPSFLVILLNICLEFFFFFFFWRMNTCKLYYSMDEISNITKNIMSGGTDSIQTTIGKESLALWGKAWATELPCLPT